jgi:RNA binding exosome subunit
LCKLHSNSPIAYVEIRVITHATEDVSRVLKAVSNLVSLDYMDKIVLDRTSLTGYYGNPITLLETTIRDEDIVEAVMQKLSESLSSLDKETLTNEIERFAEKGNLYLRLNKQAAFNNSLQLSQADPIRIRIHFKRAGFQEIIDTCKSYGLLL